MHKRILFFIIFLLTIACAAFSQNTLSFSHAFRSLGLTPQDVSITDRTISAGDAFSFTLKHVPGYRLFVWLESTNTANNVRLKDYHNFNTVKEGTWTAYLSFPAPGMWHSAVFLIPDGTNHLLNLFTFSINASAAVDEEQAKLRYREETGTEPE